MSRNAASRDIPRAGCQGDYPHAPLLVSIGLFHNGGQIKYSFVLMLINPTSLTTTGKFQKNICFKTRAVGLINIKTKECEVVYRVGKYFTDCSSSTLPLVVITCSVSMDTSFCPGDYTPPSTNLKAPASA